MPDSADTQQHAIQFAGSAESRLVFSGPPQALSGRIPLINTTGDKQKLRAFPVKAKDLQGPAELPLREVPFFVRLAPGEQASVPGSFSLDPSTPPGTYEFDIEVGAKSVAVTAFVTEVVDLAMQPESITILAGSAKSYKRQFVAENRGNVALPTGDRCEAPLFDSFDLVGSMLTGLRKSDKTSASTMVKGFLQQWSELEAGTLVVTREPMILRPGEKVTVEAEFHLPADLKPLRHYRSSLQIYNATLAVDIYTTATIQKEPPRIRSESASTTSDKPKKRK
jgi:hypothetical protein